MSDEGAERLMEGLLACGPLDLGPIAAMEAIWLASAMPKAPKRAPAATAQDEAKAPIELPPAPSPLKGAKASKIKTSRSKEPAPPTPTLDGKEARLSMGPGPGGGDQGFRVQVPSALAWPGAGGLARELTTLGRRRPDPRREVLNVEATVRATADHQGAWSPVWSPVRSRPFALTLVVEGDPFASVWGPAVEELAERTRARSAFRSVEVVHAKSARGTPRLRDQGPGRAVVLVTDATGAAWTRSDQGPRAWVREWSRTGPTAVFPLLHPVRWEETALPRQLVRARRDPTTGRPVADRAKGRLVVPALWSDPKSVDAWANLLLGRGTAPAFLWPGPKDPWPPSRLGRAASSGRDDSGLDALKAFDESATAGAHLLARRLAAVPLTPPVIRWVLACRGQGDVVETDLIDLADVLAGGLVEPVATGFPDDMARFRFRPEVAKALLARSTRADSLRVLRDVWDKIAAARPGARSFLAFLHDPKNAAGTTGPRVAGAEPFALGAAHTLRSLGYVEHALALERAQDDPVSRAVRIVDQAIRAKAKHVDLKGLGLAAIVPVLVEKLASFKSIDLSENFLGDLPFGVSAWTSLERLDLSGNPSLRTLPWELGRLSKLARLVANDVAPKMPPRWLLEDFSALKEMTWASGWAGWFGRKTPRSVPYREALAVVADLLDFVGRAPNGLPSGPRGGWGADNVARAFPANHPLREKTDLQRLLNDLLAMDVLQGQGERLRVAPDCVPRVAPPVMELHGPAGMRFLWMPPGTFLMGSPPDDDMAFDSERPQHEVKLDGFYLAVTPVTQRQYRDVVGKNPSRFQGPDRPVESVSWLDAVRYCNRLSEREKLAPYYEIGAGEKPDVRPLGGPGHRLPTEAEWEYACRAGTTTRYPFGHGPEGLEDHAWFGENSENQTHPVATKLANPWGLHDMLGNAWEWCWDAYEA